LLWGASDNIGPLVELDVIRPMEDLFDQNFLNSFIKEPIAANTWFKNHLYQIADRVGNHLCLVYNKDLVPEPPETFSDLINLGKQLSYDSDNDGKNDHYVLAWNYTEPFFAVPFIGGFGGWIMDENNQPTLNIEPTAKAAQFISDLSKIHKIIPLECDYETANAMFLDGYAAMIINGPWSWGTYTENNINFGVSRIPKIDETDLWPTPLVSPLGYSININLEGGKLNMAVELLKFLTTPANELEYTKISATIPSRKEANLDPLVTENELLQKSIDQIQVGKLMPVVSELRWIWDAMRPSYQAIFTGGKTAEEAAEDMQKLAMKLIKENRE
jgi:arabinogalactan oligomer / maltooligosaccharide transport system permease protein